MKRIVKDNSNNIFKKIFEDLKSISSTLIEDSINNNQELSLNYYCESDSFDTRVLANELLESSKKIDEKADKYYKGIGIPTKSKIQRKTKKESINNIKTSPVEYKIKPIDRMNNTNGRNISLFRDDGREF